MLKIMCKDDSYGIPRLGDHELAALTEEVIGDFLNTVQQEGNRKRDEPMSQQAMRHILALLKQILDAAVTAKQIPEIEIIL